MKEYQRQHAIFEITKQINEKKTLPAKRSQLEELKKDPAVAKYFNLLEEIRILEEKYKRYKNDGQIIRSAFRDIIREDFRCHHEIWIYEGSYYLLIDTFRHEHNDLCYKIDENLPERKGEFEFQYNRYICLECGEKVETKDWKTFEQNHFVLKNQNESINVEDYISLYYQELYNKSVKEAQETVIRTFNIEKAKTKTKTLKK